MGWPSATPIFDIVAKILLEEKEINKKKVLKSLIEVLEDGDWDAQDDSEYFEHPIVKEIFKEIHPDWSEEE